MLILLHTPVVSFEGIGIAAILILKQYVHVLNLLRQIQFIDIEEDASTWHPSYVSPKIQYMTAKTKMPPPKTKRAG